VPQDLHTCANLVHIWTKISHLDEQTAVISGIFGAGPVENLRKTGGVIGQMVSLFIVGASKAI